MRVDRQPAFILHTRDYSETSLLVEIFSRDYGRLGMIAKGAKRAKSYLRGILAPFQPLYLNWMGKGELANLTSAEAVRPAIPLRGDTLFCGFYMNELLIRLLHRHDAHEKLYDAYQASLQALQSDLRGESTLRIFEKHLLQQLGYALILDREVPGDKPIVAGRRYNYLPEHGPVASNGAEESGVIVHGSSLLALATERLSDPQTLREVKQLMRAVLAVYLNGRPLHSHRLFQRMFQRIKG